MEAHHGLTVREFERQQIEMQVEFIICDEHRSQVHFAPSSSSLEQFGVAGVTVDLSAGGLGFTSKQFLPRHCEGVVRVFEPVKPTSGSPTALESRAGQSAAAFMEHPAKVRRVSMEQRDGTYAIGLAFLEPTPQLEAQINQKLNSLHGSAAANISRDDQSGGGDHA